MPRTILDISLTLNFQIASLYQITCMRQLFKIFESAYVSTDVQALSEWYNTCVKAEIDIV
jgi:hypothetical protein